MPEISLCQLIKLSSKLVHSRSSISSSIKVLPLLYLLDEFILNANSNLYQQQKTLFPQSANPSQQNFHNGFALVPAHPQVINGANGIFIQAQFQTPPKSIYSANGYYYDAVQVNGKQLNLPIHYAKQRNIKKTQSTSLLSYPLIHFDQSLVLAQQEQQMQQFQQTKKLEKKQPEKIPFANAYVEDCFKFSVIEGNNCGLVRSALLRRDWWIQIPIVHSLYNFRWQPVSYGIKFEMLSPLKAKPGEIGSSLEPPSIEEKQMVNHFEFHAQLSEKANLFAWMQRACEAAKENVFDCCPVTFHVEIPDVDK